MTDKSIEPFKVDIDRAEIDDLRERLVDARWPDQPPNSGWEYGTNRDYLRDLCAYWQTGYDWAGFEERFNEFDQYTTTINGQRIHFYHVRSPESSAIPLLMPHGWPGSVAEFLEVLGPLSDPAAHGGDPGDAFHVVAPSLPGYGFSGPTGERGYDVEEIASVFDRLLDRLGYDDYVVQGGDWGALIAAVLGATYPDRVDAIHANMLFAAPSRLDEPMGMLDEGEMDAYRETSEFYETGFGYHEIQSTRPQTLAYGLTDSPVGLAGWIVEKFRAWSDSDDVDTAFGRDRLLDNISVYWLTETINSSMRLYYETDVEQTVPDSVDVPTGHARYPAEIIKTPRSWAEEIYDIARWNEMSEGGHFAAMEVPDLFVEEVRSFFREVDVR
ncbi:epoxide hydrolase 1 [Natronococcus sp. A-GB7]|uniref:epoxide hydrolase family protein n=1 Tax=Natronococcus sp. A-GB7 TaxID=3037649 RepID=UPI0024203630|nr:epoxide hydrolase 1 [Natronococcus sp. A-GB7]MDG5821453.1 epoxide hydrolase 1 [Natronococcus sp. A-GB7]